MRGRARTIASQLLRSYGGNPGRLKSMAGHAQTSIAGHLDMPCMECVAGHAQKAPRRGVATERIGLALRAGQLKVRCMERAERHAQTRPISGQL